MQNITNSKIYLERLAAPLQEKLKIIKYFPENFKNGLDIGCADGVVTQELANLFPNANFLGIDINPDFISLAHNRENTNRNLYFRCIYQRELLAEPQRFDAVTFISVLHEFFSYGEGISSVLKALADAHELLNKNGRIIIRDMVLNSYTKNSNLYTTNILTKIKATKYKKQIPDFEKYHGKLNTIYRINHFLLKYWYLENWEREAQEHYIPVTHEEYEQIFNLLGLNLLYKESYLIPFLKNKWVKDFDLNEEELSPLRSTSIIVGEKV